MFAVVITEKGGAQRRLEFDKNEVTIGRVQGNDIILPKGNVSKRHSRIVLKDNRFIVVDLKSTNGTYVNGRKITSPLVVKAGDKIYIGDFILTLEEGAGAGVGAGGGAPPQFEGVPSPAPGPASGPPPSMGAPPMSGPPMGGPPMSGPPMGGPPVVGPPPGASRPSAPPPLPPRPVAPPPMPAPAPMPGPAMAGPPPMPPAPMPGPPAGPPMMGPPPPAPMPMHAAPPPMPAPMPPAPADRFNLDEEPPEDARGPCVVSSAHNAPAPMPPSPAAPPMPAPTPMAAPIPVASQPVHHVSAPAAGPSASQSFARPAAAPPPRGAHAALAAVVAHATRQFNAGEVVRPITDGDPRRDTARRAVEAAVDAVSRAGGTFDRDKVGGAALDEIIGLGALAHLIEDHTAQEVLIHGADSIVVDRGQGLAPYEGYFSSAEALSTIVGRLVTMSGGWLDRNKAMHSGTLPNGVHFTAVLPPVAVGGPIVELRRTYRPGLTGEQLVSRGMLSAEMFEMLRRASNARKNIVVMGGSDGGVVQLVSALANLAGDEERLLTIEDVPNLELASPSAVRLTAVAGSSLEQVIVQGGRMRADRLVIDGARGAETLAAILELAARGGGCTLGVHSAPGNDALDHLNALARLGGASPEALGRVLANGVHVIVRVGRGRDNQPRVESIGEVRRGATGPQLTELYNASFAPSGQQPSF